ncbi:MAG: RNA polymerase sigma factor [Planctomycetota bacterium]
MNPISTTSYHRLSDADLMERCKRGDARAFHILYDRYRDWVLRQARRYVRQDSDALDVMQEVFRYLFTLVPNYKPQAQLTTLLYKVVRNTCLSEIQRRRRQHSLSLDDDENNYEAPAPEEPGLDCPLDVAQVTEAIEGMPDTYREVIVLRLVEEWAYQDIAESLGIPLGTVKSRLHNGLEILRGKLQKHLGD